MSIYFQAVGEDKWNRSCRKSTIIECPSCGTPCEVLCEIGQPWDQYGWHYCVRDGCHTEIDVHADGDGNVTSVSKHR